MGVPENGLLPQFMAFFHEEIRNMIINQWIWVPFLGQSRCLNFHIPATNPLFAGYLRCHAISIFHWGLAILAVQVGGHRSLALSIFAMITGITNGICECFDGENQGITKGLTNGSKQVLISDVLNPWYNRYGIVITDRLPTFLFCFSKSVILLIWTIFFPGGFQLYFSSHFFLGVSKVHGRKPRSASCLNLSWEASWLRRRSIPVVPR